MHKDLFLRSGLTLVLGLGIGLGAQADEAVAKLNQFNGNVRIVTGKTSVPAQPGMLLVKGHQILVLADSSAQLIYKGGCVLPLGPNSLLTIEGKNQCSEGAIVAQLNPGARLAQAGGGPVTTTAPASTVPAVVGIPVPALIAGGVVAGLVIVGATSGSSGGGGGGGGGGPISPQ